MHVVGADENGLGPRLGPLIATAATIRVRRYDRERFSTIGDELGVGDSKKVSGFGKMATAEGFALALAERELGRVPRDVDALLEAFSIDGSLVLRAPCPDPITQTQCWATPLELPAFGGSVEAGRDQLEGLKSSGIHVDRVRTGIACAGVLNREKAAGRTKLQVDLELFERLLLDARRACKQDILAICGMVGGIRSYPNYFRHFQDAEPLEGSKGEIPYRIPGFGEVRFEVKADDRHLPVGIASMVGKVVRELTMGRIVRFYQAKTANLRSASGYHDSVTAQFVKQTESLRRSLPIAQGCFQREG